MKSVGEEAHSSNNKEGYQQALQLFLSGQQQKLQQKLQTLHNQSRNESNPNPDPQSQKQTSNRFHYQLNFDQQDNETQKHQGSLKGLKTKPPPKSTPTPTSVPTPPSNIKPRMQAQRKSQYCLMCPDNEQLHLLSASNFVYVAMPKLKTFRKYLHVLIVPVDHMQTRIGADEAVLEEIKNYQKCLIQMLEKLGLHAVFLEQFCQNNSHIYVECIGIPLKKAYDLPFFFKQALENVQGFWTTHKKIIQIRKQKGGIQKQIPKQIKYFYIDFGLGYGYAHVIEDQKYWDKNFSYEIVAAALGMQSYQVKTTEQYGQEELQLKSQQFHKNWKSFDWTILIQQQDRS